MAGLTIPAFEHGKLRVFTLPSALTADQIAHALGAPAMDSNDIQIVDPAALDGIGLSGLLMEGYDAPLTKAEATELDAVAGPVAIIRSSAFEGRAATLAPRTGVTLIGIYDEPSAPPPKFTALDSDNAKGAPLGAPAPESDSARRLAARLAAFLVLGAAAVILLAVFLFMGS